MCGRPLPAMEIILIPEPVFLFWTFWLHRSGEILDVATFFSMTPS